ncbi:MAG: Na+:solute symporter [Bacteroidales bacterium]|nr:Na+:solute symporter [Bacteroidales bacterium]
MVLNTTDWLIVAAFFALSLGIGVVSARRSGRSAGEFFLSGRSMPWWLLGVSMVATTFSCDTPNLVTDIVRQNGVSGNWLWWAFLLTGMLTVFVYARLWRRSGILTDLEFYELRYGGKMAAFLRGFRAIYLGLVFNIMIIALVSLALIKIGAVMLHWPPVTTIAVASAVTVAYSALGGLRGILLTDFFQFILSMAGAIAAAVFLVNLPEVGGLGSLMANENLIGKTNLLPGFSETEALVAVFIIPLAVQWWSVWYPGSEPGGGGYIAQRMLAARNEKGAVKATLLFNVTHYALRPWPWIMVALASLVVFPDLASLSSAFPHIDPQIVKNDLAYPAMLSMLPNGLLGLVVASLIAAYMSTVSTQLNWGSSYLVNDFYKRFLNEEADEKKMVAMGRLFTILLMILAALLALLLENALQAFNIVLQVGAGTGLIFILRWFWWRVNAWSEITAMVISFLVAVYFQLIHPLTGWEEWSSSVQLLTGVGVTTFSWILVTFLTKPEKEEVLKEFCRIIKPGGPGWARFEGTGKDAGKDGKWDVPSGILAMISGCIMVYSILFATGFLIYGNIIYTVIFCFFAVVSGILLGRIWKKIKLN